MALTDKQQRFVEEYLVDLNATQAAIRAGYSVNSAMEQGYQLLQKTSVQEAITEAQQARSKRTQLTQDKVLNELALIGFARMKQYASWTTETVEFIESEKLEEGLDAAISEVTEKRKIASGDDGDVLLDRQLKVKLHDKPKALELLGKHLGLFTDKLQLTGDIKTPVQITYVDAPDRPTDTEVT